MAIKGRSRRRSRARAGLPPKPQVVARRKPWYRKRWFRRAVVSLVALAALLGGLRVWQNMSRSHSLRVYVAALDRAQDPLLQHLSPGSPTSFADLPGQFRRGEITPKQFREAAQAWERDFQTARDRVTGLRAPGSLGRANTLLARGIDMYVGVARLYVPAAIQRTLADAERNAARKQRIEDQVEVLMQHADEWRARADEVYDLGQEQIDAFKEAWLGEEPLPPPGELPGGTPEFPDVPPDIPQP